MAVWFNSYHSFFFFGVLFPSMVAILVGTIWIIGKKQKWILFLFPL